jgi:hypothetical protein
VRNPDFASTLTRIAENGAEDFYTGEIGARITADMAAHGALLSERDLPSSGRSLDAARGRLSRLPRHYEPGQPGAA